LGIWLRGQDLNL